MRKLFLLTVTLLGILASLSSCKHDDVMNVSINDEQMVSICVTIPDSETRASETNSAQGIFNNNVLGVENDNYTMRYILQIFDENGRPSDETLIEYSDGTTVSFPVRLVSGRDYTFVVWADFVTNGETNTDNHYITKDANGKTDLRNITINEDSWVAMDETRDAFTGIYSTKAVGEKYSSASTINVVLTRPFAKLRVVTTDMEALANLGINPTHAIVEYTTPYRAGFNALTCTPFEADQNNIKVHQMSPTEAYPIIAYGDNTAANKVLFTDYLFASADQNDVVKFNLSVYENADKSGHIKTNSFTTDIAVKRNHITTITGSILTEGNNVEVVVNPNFGGYIEEEFPFVEKLDPNKTIYYTATSKVEPHDSNAFNANILSNQWDAASGKGCIAFDDDIEIVGAWAFQNCTNIKSIVIPSSVTVIGDSAFSGCKNIEIVALPENLTKIGQRAFYGCGLTAISLPESLITIGDLAFNHCVNLTSVTIPNSVVNMGSSVFSGCYNIAEFKGKYSDCDYGCLIIGDVLDAYAAASNVKEFTIPAYVKKIGYSAFAHSVNLENVIIPNSVTEIGWSAFSNCSNITNIIIPNSVKDVGYFAFVGCSKLTSVVFPDYVESCWETMFDGCEKLERFSGAYASADGRCLLFKEYDNCTVGFAPAGIVEYTLPLNTKRICSTFDSDTLNTLTIPASVYEFCTSTFYNCDNLTTIYCRAEVPPTIEGQYTKPFAENITGRKIYVPINSVDAYKSQWNLYANDIVGYDYDKEIIYSSDYKLSISSSDFNTPIISHSFYNNIGVIRFNDVVTSIGAYAFDGQDINIIWLPNTITTIGNYAFENCYKLTNVYMGNSLSYIGGGAFHRCVSLEIVNIPDSVETIDAASFADCTNLTKIMVSKNILSIGIQAFRDCDNLYEFYCKATTPPNINWMAFDNIDSNFVIYVPMDSVDLYKSTQNWSDYADKIVGYNFE